MAEGNKRGTRPDVRIATWGLGGHTSVEKGKNVWFKGDDWACGLKGYGKGQEGDSMRGI